MFLAQSWYRWYCSVVAAVTIDLRGREQRDRGVDPLPHELGRQPRVHATDEPHAHHHES